MKQRNLVGILNKLSVKDQLHILYAVNNHENTKDRLHLGKLPFVDADHALDSLKIMGKVAAKGKMTYSNLVVRLRDLMGNQIEGMIKFKMYLDDSKVAKRFGTKPWLGKPMIGTSTKVTAGLKWSLPDKDYVRDEDVLVPRMLTVVPVKRGLWEVSVAESQRERATSYLTRFCT